MHLDDNDLLERVRKEDLSEIAHKRRTMLDNMALMRQNAEKRQIQQRQNDLLFPLNMD